MENIFYHLKQLNFSTNRNTKILGHCVKYNFKKIGMGATKG